jgi:hypothetical protein
MADDIPPRKEPPQPPEEDPTSQETGRDRADRGISDFVRRAVAAGFEAASKSKDDVVRVATTEIRGWLDRLELDTELRKALANMVLEVKAEVRFRPIEGEPSGGKAGVGDDGKLAAEAQTEFNVRRTPRG